MTCSVFRRPSASSVFVPSILPNGGLFCLMRHSDAKDPRPSRPPMRLLFHVTVAFVSGRAKSKLRIVVPHMLPSSE